MPAQAIMSEYDNKLLNEGWKIGQSADTFLPADMNVNSVVRAHVLPGIAPISEYDNKLLTEGWKIGQSADTFLPADQRSFITTPMASVGATATE
jgi:hypothetical protein